MCDNVQFHLSSTSIKFDNPNSNCANSTAVVSPEACVPNFKIGAITNAIQMLK